MKEPQPGEQLTFVFERKKAHIIEIPITQKQIEKAKNLYDFGALKGSIMRGKSNIFGALGEVVFYDYFKNENISFVSTFDYDMIINGRKVDVKTKRTSVRPKMSFLCTVASYNTRQKCDFYFFCMVKTDFSKAYLLGYISKKEFFKKATFNKKGELDEKGNNNFHFKADCYNIDIKDLKMFSIKK